MEHRHGVRRRSLAMADIKCRDSETIVGLMYNISHDGMFILSPKARQVGGKVEISLKMPSDSGLPVTIPGFVIHRNQTGIGVMFLDLDNSARSVVNRFLGVYPAMDFARPQFSQL